METDRVIASTEEPLFWSNENGWGSLSDATVFRMSAIETISLPEGGRWIDLPAARHTVETPTLRDWAYAHMLDRVENRAADDDEFREGWDAGDQDEQEAYLNEQADSLANLLLKFVEHFAEDPIPDWMED